jgi:hypothetical protein
MLTVRFFDGQSVVPARDQDYMHVNITITDLGYSVKGRRLNNQLTAITFSNTRTMLHGITCPAFSTGVIKKETIVLR